MKREDIFDMYREDTPTSLLASAFKLLYFNVQEAIVECWQYADRMTHACDHPIGSVHETDPARHYRGIECRKCGRWVGKAQVLCALKNAEADWNGAGFLTIERFLSLGIYSTIPGEFWSEPINSDF